MEDSESRKTYVEELYAWHDAVGNLQRELATIRTGMPEYPDIIAIVDKSPPDEFNESLVAFIRAIKGIGEGANITFDAVMGPHHGRFAKGIGLFVAWRNDMRTALLQKRAEISN